MAFAGQRLDGTSGSYLLGNGHRAYDPVLMRFRSPDTLSPMGAGGINAYAYCANDPVNRVDPSGRAPLRQKMAMQPSGELAQHYSARAASALGSTAGALMSFTGIASEYMQLRPNERLPFLQRLRRIANFHALLAPTVADAWELLLPPEDASRVGLVDNLGLASAGFFMVEAGIALASTVHTEGLSGLVPTARSVLYATGEVTFIGPALDLLTDASGWALPRIYQYVFSGQDRRRAPAIAASVIRTGESNRQ